MGFSFTISYSIGFEKVNCPCGPNYKILVRQCLSTFLVR